MTLVCLVFFVFFSSRRRHTRLVSDWSSDVCSSDLGSFTEGFYQAALAQNPKPTTVALAAEDAEFSRNACEGARENAKDRKSACRERVEERVGGGEVAKKAKERQKKRHEKESERSSL